MSISLSDLSQNSTGERKRKPRKAIVNLAQEYSASPEVKKVAQEKAKEVKLQAVVKKLDKTIAKTDKALGDAKYNLSATLELGKYSSSITSASNVSFVENPSHLDFLSNRGNPKKVLNYIIINIGSNGFFEMSTSDLLTALALPDYTLKSSLTRLSKRGFIKIVATRGVAYRRILVNPSILTF